MNRNAGGGPRSQGGKGDVGKALSLAFEFAGAVFLFWFLGRLVDDRLGIEPWGQLVGALLGWVGGFLHVYYATQKRSGRQRSGRL